MAKPNLTAPTLGEQDIQRFHSKYTCGMTPNDCYQWQGGLTQKGYPQFHVRHPKSRTMLGHRLSYLLAAGTFPTQENITQSCENKRCVNPSHLQPITASERTSKAIDRGRLQVKTKDVRKAPYIPRSLSKALELRDSLPTLSMQVISRFHSKYTCGLFPDSCWEWQRGKVRGYGYFSVQAGRNQTRTVRAHRIAYFLHYGTDPGDYLVRHSCDNPGCVNPAHLLLGSSLDNRQDCTTRKRQAVGETSGRSILTTAQVIEIKTAKKNKTFRPKRLLSYFAEKFNCSSGAISAVYYGYTWMHVHV